MLSSNSIYVPVNDAKVGYTIAGKRLFLRVIFLSSCVISASLIGILIGKLVQNNTFAENMSSIYLSLRTHIYIDPDTKTLFFLEQRTCITVPPNQRKTQKCCQYVHTVMPDCSSGTHACVHACVCVCVSVQVSDIIRALRWPFCDLEAPC